MAPQAVAAQRAGSFLEDNFQRPFWLHVHGKLVHHIEELYRKC